VFSPAAGGCTLYIPTTVPLIIIVMFYTTQLRFACYHSLIAVCNIVKRTAESRFFLHIMHIPCTAADVLPPKRVWFTVQNTPTLLYDFNHTFFSFIDIFFIIMKEYLMKILILINCFIRCGAGYLSVGSFTNGACFLLRNIANKRTNNYSPLLNFLWQE
jgi:hypothetical protein